MRPKGLRVGMEKEFDAWNGKFRSKFGRSVVGLTLWFFNAIDREEYDIPSIISLFIYTGEIGEMFGVEKGSYAFYSVMAVVKFHKKGDLFRFCWNYTFRGEDFALDVERRKSSFIFNPFI